MPVQFCTDCGNLLPLRFDKLFACDCCGLQNQSTSYFLFTSSLATTYDVDAMLESTTVSSTSQFPSHLRDKRGPVKSENVSAGDTWATVDEQCPHCHARKVHYTTVQLRSADEGSTIFYSCSGCSKRLVLSKLRYQCSKRAYDGNRWQADN